MAVIVATETVQKVLGPGLAEGKQVVRTHGLSVVATEGVLTTVRPGAFKLVAVLVHFDNTPDNITCTVTLDSALGTPPAYDNELDNFGGASTNQQRYFLPAIPIPVFAGDQIAVLCPVSAGDISYIQILTEDY